MAISITMTKCALCSCIMYLFKVDYAVTAMVDLIMNIIMD